MKLDVRLEKIRSCIVLKDAFAKNDVVNERLSFTFVFTFNVVVVDLPTDCILTCLFPAETDVLVPVFYQSTDVVVVNFVVVIKFPIIDHTSTSCLEDQKAKARLKRPNEHQKGQNLDKRDKKDYQAKFRNTFSSLLHLLSMNL